MSKLSKKSASFLFAVVLLLTSIFSFPVSAVELNTPAEITPFYVASCSGGGKHYMVGRGIAWIYSGSASKPGNLVLTGSTSQCTKCKLALGSEGNPRSGGSGIIGKYVLWNAPSTLGTYGTVFYGGIQGSFYGNKSQDAFWGGFTWN